MAIKTVAWMDNCVRIIDQTQLPQMLVYQDCRDVKTLWTAIRRLAVRGAPAIGVAAAWGVILGAHNFKGQDKPEFLKIFENTCAYLATARPTAVNLFNKLDQMRRVVSTHPDADVALLKTLLFKEATRIHKEDQEACRDMGRWGATLIQEGMRCLTVCNAGALATVDYGTALGVFYSAKAQGKTFSVYACETRPLLQGARLTAWELQRQKIDTTLICDNMAASLMAKGGVDIIFAGADRIASNGDTANKIGTYMLAVLARYHRIPLYIVAPRSTFDLKIKSGKEIPIEERSADEVTHLAGKPIAPRGIKAYNPAFDVTPASLITGIITEKGILTAPYRKSIRAQQGFSLIEVIVVLIILGGLAAIAIPNYLSFVNQSAQSAAQKNLLAIVAAEQNYYFANAGYCTKDSNSTCGDSVADINSNLTLNIQDNHYSYACSALTPPAGCTLAGGSNANGCQNSTGTYKVYCQATNNASASNFLCQCL